MIKILFLKEAHSDIFNEINNVLDSKFDIVHTEQPDKHKDHEYYYGIAYEEKVFSLYVRIRTFNKISSVILELGWNRELDIKSEIISNFKIDIKNAMMSIMSKCYWIEDDQMIAFSKEAYTNINKAENMFRSFMLSYMINIYGEDWIESIDKELKGNINGKSGTYTDAIKDLKDVNMDLYSLNINELSKLIGNEYDVEIRVSIKDKKEVQCSDEDDYKDMKRFIKDCMKNISDSSINIRNINRKMFWEESIGKYVDDSNIFREKWDRVCVNRNHVAHNKPIDRNMYDTINLDTQYVIDNLRRATNKLNKSIKTEEDIQYYRNLIEEEKHYELSMCGVKVYDESEIEQELEEYFTTYIDMVDDELYSNEDFEYEDNHVKLENDYTIIKIVNKITKDELRVYVKDFNIDNSVGGESEVTIGITANGINESGRIIFTSADAEENEDTGTYMPERDSTIDDSSLVEYIGGKTTNIIANLIERFISR